MDVHAGWFGRGPEANSRGPYPDSYPLALGAPQNWPSLHRCAHRHGEPAHAPVLSRLSLSSRCLPLDSQLRAQRQGGRDPNDDDGQIDTEEGREPEL